MIQIVWCVAPFRQKLLKGILSNSPNFSLRISITPGFLQRPRVLSLVLCFGGLLQVLVVVFCGGFGVCLLGFRTCSVSSLVLRPTERPTALLMCNRSVGSKEKKPWLTPDCQLLCLMTKTTKTKLCLAPLPRTGKLRQHNQLECLLRS